MADIGCWMNDYFHIYCMNWCLNILCKIYTSLIILGIKISPPSILFNNPKKKINASRTETIHADITFDEKERQYILQAAEEWRQFSNQSIDIKIDFDLNAEVPFNYETTLIKATASDPITVESDGYFKCTILGLCKPNADETIDLYIIYDRLKDPITFRSTVMHEIGHFLGLDHTPGNSIMSRRNHGNILHLTYNDAIEFAKKYKCQLSDLRYFCL